MSQENNMDIKLHSTGAVMQLWRHQEMDVAKQKD